MLVEKAIITEWCPKLRMANTLTLLRDPQVRAYLPKSSMRARGNLKKPWRIATNAAILADGIVRTCLLYTSDAADDTPC
eukprot:6239619-Pyramimonas_sp.AAC.1